MPTSFPSRAMSFFPYVPANGDISETGHEHSLDHQVRDVDPALPQEVPRFVEHPNASATTIIAELVPPSQISRENRHHLAQRNEELENQLEFERRQVELERQRRLQLEAQLGGPERDGENDDTRIPKCRCCSTGRVTRKRWIVACIAVVVLVMVCAVTVWTTRSSRKTKMPGPRSEAEALAIQDFINSKTFTKQPLSYPSQDTPGEQALQWLIDKDLSTDVSDTLSLLQRFVLGTLWFANGPLSDRFGNHIDTWLSPRDVCQWRDIRGCVNGEVTWLELNSNGLNGTIPADVGLLTALSRLSLSSNQFTGTIPSEIGGLTDLTLLWLNDNELIGTIPNQVQFLTRLTSLWFSENQLSGSIPTQIGSVTQLKALTLWRNQLIGSIPTQIGSLTGLTDLALQQNQLEGTIPTHIGSLTQLTWVTFWQNQLTGSIPSQVGAMTSLTTLGLSNNQLFGTIPTQIGALTGLFFLSLERNQLDGTIPTLIGSLTQLTTLFLWQNQLTGSIPSQILSLTSLTSFSVALNDLTGTMPFCNGDSSRFDTLQANCSEVKCLCCTSCY